MEQMRKPDPKARGERLAGMVAVVTGIGSGIGRGCALMFARQGAHVVGCELDAASAEATRDMAAGEGLSIDSLHPCDLTDPAAAPRLMQRAAERHGGLDILVNAAAAAVFKWLPDLSYEDWRRTLRCELDIVFLACQAAWPHLIRRGGGSIINFASVNAYMALEGSAALAHCAGKGGVLAMTRQLAMEGGPHRIRANTISPGMIVTGATKAHLKREPGLVDKILTKKMIKRLGQPEDVAWLATFLASDESSWITASDYAVDGGARAW